MIVDSTGAFTPLYSSDWSVDTKCADINPTYTYTTTTSYTDLKEFIDK